MAIPVTVPRLGWSMEEGTFGGWLKKEGDRIRQGDILFTLESEKATEEIETLDAGILCIPSDAPKAGDTVKVGQILAHLVADGETAPTTCADNQTAERQIIAEESAVKSETRQPGQPGPPSPKTTGMKPLSSPRARRVAKELGVDWHGLKGSGRNGRVRERDIRAATSGKCEGRLFPHTKLRRIIATRMVAGVTEAAPVTLTTRVDATNLVNLRQQFKAAAASADDILPGYTDMAVKLAGVVLQQHPLLRAQWREEGLFVPDKIDIAIAVDTEAGLLVPVIREVDRLTLRQVVAQSRDLIDQARAGKLTSALMRDATFTITNLGSFDIDAFTPIIHLPQCATLGVGRIVREPAVHNDQIIPRDMLTLSLTFDHRVVDGAPAARFLQALGKCIENPAPWLVA